ncbi:MAG: galactokinase [Bacteroidia bacterium]|nr:galactokinase [Bacteroidia bacterium]
MNTYASPTELMLPVHEVFQQRYHTAHVLAYAPGRINLIGEHTDYNDGYVLPAAVDKGITFAVARTDTPVISLYARDLDQTVTADIRDLKPVETTWANYLLGVVDQLLKKGYTLGGFNCVFGGNLPSGAGMSSSAALESGMIVALDNLFGLQLDRMEMARLGQMAEHTFVGMKCGIMDQFSSLMGKAGHVVLLDCRSLAYQYVPFNAAKYSLLLVDTKVHHELASSEYNNRRKECEAGVKRLQLHYPEVLSLRDVTVEMLQEHRESFHPLIYKRCLYVVEENARVLQAVEGLKASDYAAAGKLMYASHEGLSYDYEVSCRELDFLVNQASKDSRILGARMMGGGFGGCTINLVPTQHAQESSERLQELFAEKYGYQPDAYTVQIHNGAYIADN